jgi:hypothetical protein
MNTTQGGCVTMAWSAKELDIRGLEVDARSCDMRSIGVDMVCYHGVLQPARRTTRWHGDFRTSWVVAGVCMQPSG